MTNTTNQHRSKGVNTCNLKLNSLSAAQLILLTRSWHSYRGHHSHRIQRPKQPLIDSKAGQFLKLHCVWSITQEHYEKLQILSSISRNSDSINLQCSPQKGTLSKNTRYFWGGCFHTLRNTAPNSILFYYAAPTSSRENQVHSGVCTQGYRKKLFAKHWANLVLGNPSRFQSTYM